MAASASAPGLYLDRYELAMAAVYWREGRAEERAVFDYFFRTLPFGGGYAVFAGLGSLIEALEDFRFEPEQLEFLADDGFEAGFLDYLGGFRFRGSLWAPPEGEIVFPQEPLVRVEGGLLEAQVVETLLLNVLNFQSLIASKAARCLQAAEGRALSEFGMRRAQGLGSRWASRAAAIGGCASTSNLEAASLYGLRAVGTMAHAFIQSYDDELGAFRRFAEVHRSSTVLLLDTYDTLASGLPHACRVAAEMRERGEALKGVRLDSGDLAYLSGRVREGLDEAGFPEVQIMASNQLDEHVIGSLLRQGAPIDSFGVGTALATGAPDGALDGVYKLARAGGQPRLKASESIAKSTLPDRKMVHRYHDGEGRFRADAVHLAADPAPARMWHPHEPLQELDLSRWTPTPLLLPVFADGRPTAPLPSVSQAASYARERLQCLPTEHCRFENPHTYKVGLSGTLRSLRDRLLTEKRKAIAS